MLFKHGALLLTVFVLSLNESLILTIQGYLNFNRFLGTQIRWQRIAKMCESRSGCSQKEDAKPECDKQLVANEARIHQNKK
uniref:Secreted protein n=1 Tax=Ascaris lumbricoides TaxID=6252 RepID=A0A0M3HW17_ASCLU